ncbi:MAG: tetratricopeptide repeat protein [Polyangiaceae bacterium]
MAATQALGSATDDYDAFISYACADHEWVHELADNLFRLGVRVWLDKYELQFGDVIVPKLEDGIRRAKVGALILSPASVTRPWVQEEYAAIMTRSIAGQQRLIPVLFQDVELPPFVASRRWFDFRAADSEAYLRRVRELAAALQGDRPTPPRFGEALQPPPGSAYLAEGALRRTLRISKAAVTLCGGARDVQHTPSGLSHATEQRLWHLERARRRSPAAIDHATRADGSSARAPTLHSHLLEVGAALTSAFLAGDAGLALAEAVAEADRRNVTLELGLQLEDAELFNLPWETLRLPDTAGTPGEPLALHRCVEIYRKVEVEGATPSISIPGPLRILVAIGSPESQTERGELLDTERELARILDAVEPARDKGRAYVRILRRGTLDAIREALETQRFHVLHLSCHAGPGVLVLEDAEGREDRVSAERFVSELLPPNRGVPLIVLSGCSTALRNRGAPSEDDDDDAGWLPGLAGELLAHGAPAVVAMNAVVSDRYAIRWGEAFYAELSAIGDGAPTAPAPLRALANVRRTLEVDRLVESARSPAGELAEWATPVLLLRGQPLPLYDASAQSERIETPSVPQLPGVVVRRVGDFVGRRRDERLALAALTGDRSGVLLHGLGGVGKSTLAAQLVSDAAERGFLIASLTGTIAVDQIFEAIGARLLATAIANRFDEQHSLRQLASFLRRPDQTWRDRLQIFRDQILSHVPVLLLLDNFEDNLTDQNGPSAVRDTELAQFLSAWLKTPARGRLLFTCRFPFTLRDHAEHTLETRHIGPLSLAETRQLLWRLPAVNRLSPDEKQSAYASIGGHPRTFEYLDALLQGGKARFPDIRTRIEQQLKKRNIDNPSAWLATQRGKLNGALAEAVTLAADDVLIDELLARARAVPLAAELALGSAVYRVPVDESGLRWQLSDQLPEDPADLEEEAAILRELEPYQTRGGGVPPHSALPPELRQRLATLQARLARAPLTACPGFETARVLLEQLGLLAPLESPDAAPNYEMHRWTAAMLESKSTSAEQRTAHARAAAYFRWRVRRRPQSRSADIEDWLEARHHFRRADQTEAALSATHTVCQQLQTWGAYARVEQLLREALSWVPERSSAAAAYEHQLGMIAELRSDYDGALVQYKKSLQINEQLGNRAGTASSYHHLGIIAQRRGDYDGALEQCEKSLQINEQLGDRDRMASSYHQLGMIAQQRGDYDGALVQYKKSLQIKEELGNRAGMASSYHQLGMIAQQRGDYDGALEQYKKSLEILKELGNRAGMASSYHQLGMIAQQRGDYDGALEQYKESLQIKEELGNRAGTASSYHHLGIIAQLRGDYDGALEQYKKSLEILEELGDRAGMASSYHQLGMIAQERGDYDGALEQYKKSLEINEQLGNRAGMTSSRSQMGVLLTEMGQPATALAWSLSALLLCLELKLPEARLNLHWLRQQRTALGEEAFQRQLREHLNEENAQSLVAMLDLA